MPSKDLTPLYYSDSQMAQMLQPPPDQLSTDAGPTDLNKLFPQLYASQANQSNQPQGYARGGRLKWSAPFSMPNYRHLARGGPVYNINTDPLAQATVPLDPAHMQAVIEGTPSIMRRYDVIPPSPESKKPDADILDEYRSHPEYLQRREELEHHAKGGMTGPSEAQKHAGNYKKMHGHVHGMDVSIENEAGSFRNGKGKDGKPWSVRMPVHYGYLKGTEGADGDHVDTFVGHRIDDENVHVINQVHPDTGKFDEHKVMMGFTSPHEALHAYHGSFSDGKAHLRMGGMVSMHVDEFKKWLKKRSATKKPMPVPKHPGGENIMQRFAAGGAVMPRLKQYASNLPTPNYVPPMQHYRDALGNNEMSQFRNNLQDMVR